jgi:hypothetical protein
MSGGDKGRASNPARRGRRGTSFNEEGLRALGDPGVQPGAQAPPSTESSTTPHDAAVDTRPRVANEAGLMALAEQLPPPSRRWRRQYSSTRRTPVHRWRRRVLIGLVVLLVVIGGGAGYLYYEIHDLNRTEVRGLNGALTTGAEAGTENILMVGSTSRCALAHQNLAYGLCAHKE